MKHIEWGYLIIFYLFLGGLSAGMFFISGVAAFVHKGETDQKCRIAFLGAMLAPWPVAIGSGLLIFDLGNWYRFYKLFVHLNPTSPMSIGAWLLMGFTVVTFVYLWAWLDPHEREALRARVPRGVSRSGLWRIDLSPWRRKLAAAGIPLAIGVGIYTGVLLGAVQSRPFWNTNLVAQLFLFSALSTGSAALMLALVLTPKGIQEHELRLLYLLDIGLLTLEFFIVLPYIIHGQLSTAAVQDSLQLIMGGPFTLAFWLVFLGFGVLVPLGIELFEMAPAIIKGADLHVRSELTAITAVFILGGGFLLRYIFVFAGQMSSFK